MQQIFKILLTNFMGYSQEEADMVIGATGECNCNAILSDADLERIKKDLL